MPTKTVTKGTNRPAAVARSNRHAQRTSLPPKPGQIEAARDGEAEGQERATQYGAMGLDELRARAKELEIRPLPRTKGALLNAILESERISNTSSYDVAKDYASQRQLEIDEIAGSVPAPTATAEPKGTAKAERFAFDIKPHGWETSVVCPAEGTVELIAKRGNEILVATWINGSCSYDGMSYVVGDRITKPRNANAARVLAARAPEAAKAELARVGANRAWKRKAAAPTVDRSKLPFDPETATEAELWTQLQGRKITWFNRHSSGTEVARVSADPRWFAVSGKGTERVVQFCSKDGGFRACRLAAIQRVGR